MRRPLFRGLLIGFGSEFFCPQDLNIRQKYHHLITAEVMRFKVMGDGFGDALLAKDFNADVGAGRPGCIAAAVGTAAAGIRNGVAVSAELR